MIFFTKFHQEALWKWGSIFGLVLYLIPLIIYGDKLQFLAFDNLDSNVVWFKVLAESGHIFSSNDTIIPNIMHGLPRLLFGSEFDVLLWLYYFFTPIHAYIINEILMHSVAFISMYIFLDKYLFKEDHNENKSIYTYGGALFFALSPFWPSAGLSLPLMPLLTLVMLRFEQRENNWQDWLFVFLFPLYTHFILIYFFYLLLAAIYFISKSIKTRTFNVNFFLALLFITIIFLLKDYRLVLAMFFEHDFISNRSEYFSLVDKSFLEAYRNSLLQFLDGVPHAKGIHLAWLLPASLFTVLLALHKDTLSSRNSLIFLSLFILSYFLGTWDVLLKQIYTLPLIAFLMIFLIIRQKRSLLAALILAQVFIAFWYGFSFYKSWNTVFEFFPALKMFNFSRFFFISQILWALIAAVMIKNLIEKVKFTPVLLILFIILQFNTAVQNALFSTKQGLYYMPFDKYYAHAQFQKIKEFINRPQESYYLVSLGIEPAVAQYNGFYTLDGYMVNYPLTYKHNFRKIINRYLDKEAFHKDLFDGWGSKAYLFNDGVRYAYYNEHFLKSLRTQTYKNIDINTSQISQMGGEYLISAKPIQDAVLLDLYFLKTFFDANSLWSVSLYKIGNDE